MDPTSSLRDAFPLAHGTADAVDASSYRENRNRALEYALSATGPALAPETVRYQSVVLYSSLLLAFLSLFSAKQIKLFGVDVEVDHTLLTIYSGFILGAVLIFCLKAWVDYQRSEFVRSKGAEAVSELQEMLGIGALRRSVHHYFWSEAFLAIGSTYATYRRAAARALQNDDPEPGLQRNAVILDLKALRKIPALQAEIDRQESFLADLKAELRTQEEKFETMAHAILQMREEDVAPEQTKYDLLRSAFDQTLGPWLDARNKLTDEGAKAAIAELEESPMLARSKDLFKLLQRMLRIRRLYFWTEVGGPLALAGVVVIYALA